MYRNEDHAALLKAIEEAVKTAKEAGLEVYVDVRAFNHDLYEGWFRVNEFTTERN